MTLLNQMQSVPDSHDDADDETSDAIQQETHIDSARHHHSMPIPQVDRITNHHGHSLPRYHARTFSNQKCRVFPRRVESDLNGNLTHTMPTHNYSCQGDWRTFRAKSMDHRLDINRRRRLLSEPVAHTMCTCHHHRAMTQVRNSVGHRMQKSYRSRLPKFNLAGENIPTSSEPSMVRSVKLPH